MVNGNGLLCLLATFLHVAVSGCAPQSSGDSCTQAQQQVKQQLSPGSTLQCGGADVRWSDYKAPQPGAIVTVGAESDIAKIVKYATQNNIPFLVQSGANGWATTFTLNKSGFIIDVSKLKGVTFNGDKTQATIQTGVTNQDLVNAAYNAGARAVTATCNCVSIFGAGLGGGLTRLQGMYGQIADNLISANVVDAFGNQKTVTAQSDPDLWWALKGAGANFALVTSAVVRTYPLPQAQNVAWTGLLIFDPAKIAQVVNAINALNLEPEMAIEIYMVPSGPGQYSFAVVPFYLGSEATGRSKFASILSIGPLADQTALTPYTGWNAPADNFCIKGGRKPVYSVALKNFDGPTYAQTWQQYTQFVQQNPAAGNTSILVECHSNQKANQIGSSQSSFPWRGFKCYALVSPIYFDPALDNTANQFGQRLRNLWQSTAGTPSLDAYINYAHGDESLSSIYGASLSRLQTLKQKYDPRKVFNQWFPLS